MLSFLTVMTPSGRLYEVDTRLRPNGRAGSLVSSISAFGTYQLDQAWTWELQALTRARFIAGSPALEAHFNRIRQEVLCLDRNEKELAAELLEMRQRMLKEQAAKLGNRLSGSPKHGPGGLVDIEFIAQLGVLANARLYPRVIRATGTGQQINELASIGWLSGTETQQLLETMAGLRNQKLMAALIRDYPESGAGMQESAAIFHSRLGAEA